MKMRKRATHPNFTHKKPESILLPSGLYLFPKATYTLQATFINLNLFS